MDKQEYGWFRRHSVVILTILGVLFTAIVAGVAGYVSWGHIVEVGSLVGEKYAVLSPVTIDGLMLVGTVMGAVDRIRGYKARVWAVIALWTGSILTLTFNAAYALLPLLTGEGSLIARLPNVLIAVLFAVALLISVETMFHPSQRPLRTIRKIAEIVSPSETPQAKSENVPSPGPVPAAMPAFPGPSDRGRPGRKPGPQPNQPPRRKQKHTSWNPGIQAPRPKVQEPIVAKVIPPARPPAAAQLENDQSLDHAVEGEVVP